MKKQETAEKAQANNDDRSKYMITISRKENFKGVLDLGETLYAVKEIKRLAENNPNNRFTMDFGKFTVTLEPELRFDTRREVFNIGIGTIDFSYDDDGIDGLVFTYDNGIEKPFDMPRKWLNKLSEQLVGHKAIFDILETWINPISVQDAEGDIRIRGLIAGDSQILANSLILSLIRVFNDLLTDIDEAEKRYIEAKTKSENLTEQDYLFINIVQLIDKEYQKRKILDKAQQYLNYLEKNDKAAFDEVNAFIDEVLEKACSTRQLKDKTKNAIRVYRQKLKRQQQRKTVKPLEHNQEGITLPNSLAWNHTRAMYRAQNNIEQYPVELRGKGYEATIQIGVKDKKGVIHQNAIELKVEKKDYKLQVLFYDCYDMLTTHYLRAGKLLDLIIHNCYSQQAVYNGKVIKKAFSIPVATVIKCFQYTSERALRKEFKDIANVLMRMMVYAKTKYKNSTSQALATFFKLIKLQDNEITVKLNEEAPWETFMEYVAPYPEYYFELPTDAYNLLSNCLYYARTNAPQLQQGRDSLYIDVPLQNIADYMGLPAVKGAKNPYRNTVERILDAVDEIHRKDGGKKEIVDGVQVETPPASIEITLPQYIKGRGESATKPREWMNQKLRLFIRNDLGLKYLAYKTRQVEAESKAKKRREANKDKAIQKALADQIGKQLVVKKRGNTTA